MGNLIVGGNYIRDGLYIALDQPQAVILSEFEALFKQHLHTQADAQQGLAFLCQSDDVLVKTRSAQLCGGIAECAYARQNDLVRVCQNLRVSGDHALYANGRQRAFHLETLFKEIARSACLMNGLLKRSTTASANSFSSSAGKVSVGITSS